MKQHASPQVGAVVIGRNEGERLMRCLRSLHGRVEHIVYVDSGSTDGSVEFARSLGVEVVELNLNRPFTMARGRNAGFRRLQQLLPELAFVQFVDGDCEVVDGWVESAAAALEKRENVGSVSGHRYEINRDASIYNRLTDMEWREKPGEARSLGGDVMMRAAALRECGGYQEHMIAGEDPEICVRLRACGWKLLRLDRPMTRHDAAMARFSQWWRRTVRSGHAYAEGAHMHRLSPERFWRREVMRNWFWGLALPTAAMVAAWPTFGLSLLLLGLYPIWMVRIACHRRRTYSDTWGDAWLYALACMVGKVPAAFGQALYWWRRLRGQVPQLIEYKETSGLATPAADAPASR